MRHFGSRIDPYAGFRICSSHQSDEIRTCVDKSGTIIEVDIFAGNFREYLASLNAKFDDTISSGRDGNQAAAAIWDAAFVVSIAIEISVINTDMTVVQAPARFGTPNGIESKIWYV